MELPQLERRALADIVEDPGNARTHTKKQVQQIAESIRRWGWTNAIVVDEENRVIAGHGRIAAARVLGHADVPVLVVRGLSHTERQALALADNKIAINAGWDYEKLGAALAAIKSNGVVDLSLTGFSNTELASIAGNLVSGLDTKPALAVALRYQVVIDCVDEAQQAALMERFEKEGLSCQLLIL